LRRRPPKPIKKYAYRYRRNIEPSGGEQTKVGIRNHRCKTAANRSRLRPAAIPRHNPSDTHPARSQNAPVEVDPHHQQCCDVEIAQHAVEFVVPEAAVTVLGDLDVLGRDVELRNNCGAPAPGRRSTRAGFAGCARNERRP
jgi:hypothetical protein